MTLGSHKNKETSTRQTQLARAHPERQVDPHSEFHLLWRREDTVIVNYVHICLFHLRF